MFPGHDPGDKYASDERHDDRYHLLYRYAFFEKEQGEDHDVVRRGHLQECRKGQVDKHLGLEQGDVRHELERSEQGEQQHVPRSRPQQRPVDREYYDKECDGGHQVPHHGDVHGGESVVPQKADRYAQESERCGPYGDDECGPGIQVRCF